MATSTIKKMVPSSFVNAPTDWNAILTSAPSGIPILSVIMPTSWEGNVGAPSDSPYKYGLLITLKGNGYSNEWSCIQVYIPDSSGTTNIYFRSGVNRNWRKLSGVAVPPLT